MVSLFGLRPGAIYLTCEMPKAKGAQRWPASAGLRADDSRFYRAHGGLGAVGYPEFGDYVLDVDLDGSAADREVPGDLGVRLALAEEREDLDLPRRKGLYPLRLISAGGARPS